MEDDLKILANGRRPQYFGKRKLESISFNMEEDLNVFAIGRQSQFRNR